MEDSGITTKRWHWLTPRDQRYNNYIFWKDTTKREIRERYKHLVCKGCHKIDEEKALSLGFEPDLKIRSRHDYVSTIDGMICVTDHFREVVEQNQITGLSYVPLPDGKYHLVQPEYWLTIDLEKAGFKYAGKQCAICGRHRSIHYFPARESYQVPSNENVICAPTSFLEDGIARVLWLLASAKTKKILKDSKVTGIDYASPF